MTGFLSTASGDFVVNINQIKYIERRPNILKDTAIGGPSWELVTDSGIILESAEEDTAYLTAAEWLSAILLEVGYEPS